MTVSRQSLERASKRVFTKQHRLRIAGTLLDAPEDVVDHPELTARSGVPGSTVHVELQFLADLGAVARLESRREVAYQVVPDHLYWAFCSRLLADADTGNE